MGKGVVKLLALLLMTVISASGQMKEDKSLFTIFLSDDTSSLFFCRKGGEICRTLSGPVVMSDSSLMFFSINGYVLYNQKGSIIDSLSVFDENKKLSEEDPRRMRFAYPVDRSTVLFYKETSDGERPVEIFQKKLFKKRMKPIKEDQYEKHRMISKAQLFNLAHNTITDEMASKAYLQPQLVGFSSFDSGDRWWSIDKFFSFSSSVIYERDGICVSFFPGIKASGESEKEIRRQMVDALSTFERNGRKYYVGIYATMGTSKESYDQTIFICDEPGNILHTDKILKQTNIDAVLGEDVEEKMLYTVKQTAKHVFQPSVDDNGSVYYGIMDYEGEKIDVHKITYSYYSAVPSEPDLAHLLDIEKDISYEPIVVPCNPQQQGGKTIPDIMLTNEKGKRIKATAKEITRDEYIARISRQIYRDVEKKLSRSRLPVPESVHAIMGSLSKKSTSGCPYAVSLSGPKGMLRTFDYSSDEEVMCARVIRATESGEVLIRVDLGDYAEILVFTKEGDFVNRFVFNRQNYKDRRDVVAASADGKIIELDFETDKKKEIFFRWARDSERAGTGGI